MHKKTTAGDLESPARTKGDKIMDEIAFQHKLNQLREGSAILRPDDTEIREHAKKHLPDLLQYASALEGGYRNLQARLTAYRGEAKGKTLGQVMRNQWSDGACLGYAAMALVQTGWPCDKTVAVLELMEELMEGFDQVYAAEYHQGLKEGKAPPRKEEKYAG